MALTDSFKARDIREYLDATHMRGKNITFLDDFSRDEIQSLFYAAEMLEPFMRTGTDLLKGKVLYTLFFQPSTRTRCSHENAMHRLGGAVITEADPTHNSSVAKNESLADSLRVTSEYADVIVMRHPNDVEALGALKEIEGHCAPVISGGYGHVTHPTQGLLDSYTCWRAFGDLSKVTVAIASPDLSRARSGQSFALALAAMGAKIIYTGTSELRTPDIVREKLCKMGAQFEEHFDLTQKQHEELYMDKGVDLIYLPGCSVKKDDPNREDFVNNPRLKSKALQLLPRQRRIRPVYVRPLSHQPVTQTLQISTCIEVAVRTVTTVAFEPVLFTLSNGTACRTGLACVFGVNKHHADADTTGFVDDHLLKLAERPTVQPGTNSESRPDPFPDMGKIFQDDQSFSLRLSFFYDLFADHVIHLFHMSSFSARDSFQRAFGVSRTIALKTSSVTQELVAVIL